MKKLKINLFFLLGLFSSLQLVEVFGKTIFTWLLLLTVAFYFFTEKKIRFRFTVFTLYMVSITLTECINLFSPVGSAWKSRSINAYILLWLVFFTFQYIRLQPIEVWKAFLGGLYQSCVIQVVWCYLQMLFYHIFHLDINKLIFTDFMHVQETTSYFRKGHLVINGITSNAGMLAPVFIIGMMMTNNALLKAAIAALCLLSGNSSLIIGIFVYFLLSGVKQWKKIQVNRIRKGHILIGTGLLAAVCVVLSFRSEFALLDRFQELFVYFIDRIISIFRQNITDGSTFAHVRYYTAIPYILSNTDLITNLFGYGLGCAGIPYSLLFHQYTTLIWIPESDFVAYLFNGGIAGVLLYYIFLARIVMRGIRLDYKYFVGMVSLIMVGFFYGIQLNWVILFELILYELMKRKYMSSEIFGDYRWNHEMY